MSPQDTPDDESVDAKSGLGLYLPLQQPKPIAPDVWVVDDGVVWMTFPMIQVPFTTRMMVVRLQSGDLVLISPTTPTPACVEAVSALGRVAHLVSPNAIHYVHIAAWKKLFPDAVSWASPGVRERASSQGLQLEFDEDLEAAPAEAWAEEIDQLIFEGSPALREVVFFHRASRTLILTDLIENFEPDRIHHRSWRIATRLAGTQHPNGKAPLDVRLSFWGRRAIARECAERMLAWEPEHILLAHGRCYHEGAQAELRRAFRWTGLR